MKRNLSSIFLALLAGPLIWAAQFTVVYGSEAILCATRGATAHQATILTATGLAAAALMLRMVLRAAGPVYLAQMAFGLDILSLVAVVWTGLPALVLSSCVGPGGT